ncbi:MAG: hypothetical protein GWO11_08585 [Desulfuromonadales bacterium]|nr:hypothetical protein [Desulfuromonadales bacterium]NIR34353.1 hypothetical protein [Desulfuromonadales bacterium]NIS40413.1 hypothetical protein [Desulfuromonadales bacterium]
MIFKLIVAMLAIGWAAMALTSFCPLRAIRRRREKAEIEAEQSAYYSE